MGNNQIKSRASYLAHKATRRRTRAREFQRQQTDLGAGADIDGRQAIIDLMADAGTRMAPSLYQSLVEAGYEVPEHIRPRGAEGAEDADDADEKTAGSATHTPAVPSPEEDPSTTQDTTDDGTCQQAGADKTEDSPDDDPDRQPSQPRRFYNTTLTRKERKMLGLGEYARANGNGRPGPLSRTEGIGPRRRDGTPLNNPGTVTGSPPAAIPTGAKEPAERKTTTGPAPTLPPRDEAFQAARAALADDPAALARLEQAALLLEIDAVQQVGPGQYLVVDRFHVGKHCDCIDHTAHQVDWCIHRLAVALYLKARQIETERAAAGPDVKAEARKRDGALPADHPRGRNRLFKS